MSKSSTKSILSGSVWGIISKIADSVTKLITIPMLVGFFGKADYGLIALAFSLNAYLRLMDLGMNIGSIRYFSMWLSKGEWEKIEKVSCSSIVFYGVIGLINAIVFGLIAIYTKSIFNVSPAQVQLLQWILCILAVSSIINWLSYVVIQLLSAGGELGFVNGINIISSIGTFLSAFLTIKFHYSLTFYFSLYMISTLITIPMCVYRLNVFKIPRLKLLMPKWDGAAFSEIFKYGLAILAMGVFQFSADNLRPIFLGMYASKGTSVLTEFRVLQTITLLVLSIGVILRQNLLPSASKLFAENQWEKIENLVYGGTKFITVFISLLVFGLIVNAQSVLIIYMGDAYANLAPWLIIWLLTVLLTLHKLAIDSLILSTGRTRFLVFSSGISCLATLPITIFLAPKYNVGAAVIGYFVYVLIEVCGYYFYLIKNVLNLSGSKVFFSAFLPTFLIGIFSAISTGLLMRNFIHNYSSKFVTIGIQSSIFLVIFAALIFLFVLKSSEINEVKKRLGVLKAGK